MSEAVLQRGITEEEQEHKKQISENYRRLLDLASPPSGTIEETRAPSHESYESYAAAPAPVAEPAPVSAPAAEPEASEAAYAPAHASIDPAMENVARIAEHNRYAMDTDTRAARLWSPQMADYAAAPAFEMSEEDALPTARTMDTLHRAPVIAVDGEAVATEQRVGFFSALSTRTKTILLALVSAIVISFVLICINSAILNSLNTDIAAKENRLGEIARDTQRVEQRIDDLTDPDNVDQWASDHGLVLGG